MQGSHRQKTVMNEIQFYKNIIVFRDGTRGRDRQILDTIELLSMGLPLAIDISALCRKWNVDKPQLMNRLSEVHSLGIIEIKKTECGWMALHAKKAYSETKPTSVYESKSWRSMAAEVSPQGMV